MCVWNVKEDYIITLNPSKTTRVNDILGKWEKWFHTYDTLIAYISCNDQEILLIFVTEVKKTTTLCSSNGYCQVLLSFWATLHQNFDNFILGHTVHVHLISIGHTGYDNGITSKIEQDLGSNAT